MSGPTLWALWPSSSPGPCTTRKQAARWAAQPRLASLQPPLASWGWSCHQATLQRGPGQGARAERGLRLAGSTGPFRFPSERGSGPHAHSAGLPPPCRVAGTARHPHRAPHPGRPAERGRPRGLGTSPLGSGPLTQPAAGCARPHLPAHGCQRASPPGARQRHWGLRTPGRWAGVCQLPRKHHRPEDSRVGVRGSPCATLRWRGPGVRLGRARGQQAKAEQCPCLQPPTQEPERQRQLGLLARDGGSSSKSPTRPPLLDSQPPFQALRVNTVTPVRSCPLLCCCPRSATQVLPLSPCVQLRLLPSRPSNGSL